MTQNAETWRSASFCKNNPKTWAYFIPTLRKQNSFAVILYFNKLIDFFFRNSICEIYFNFLQSPINSHTLNQERKTLKGIWSSVDFPDKSSRTRTFKMKFPTRERLDMIVSKNWLHFKVYLKGIINDKIISSDCCPVSNIAVAVVFTEDPLSTLIFVSYSNATASAAGTKDHK